MLNQIIEDGISIITYGTKALNEVIYDGIRVSMWDGIGKYNAVSDSSGTITQFSGRKQIKLTHSGTLTDHQKLLSISYESKILTAFQDIRFTNNLGVHIPYWIESKTDSISVNAWIKNNYLNGDTYIYMYYGNSDLTDDSNGSDVFLDYLDFEDDIEGYLTGAQSTDYAFEGTNSFLPPIGSYGRRANTIFTKPYIYEKKVYIPSGQSGRLATNVVSFGANNIGAFIAFGDATNNNIWYYLGGSWTDSGVAYPTNQWFTIKVDVNASDIDVYMNASTILTGSTYVLGGDYPNKDNLYRYPEKTVYFDATLVRKYTTIEPVYSIGAEQVI